MKNLINNLFGACIYSNLSLFSAKKSSRNKKNGKKLHWLKKGKSLRISDAACIKDVG